MTQRGNHITRVLAVATLLSPTVGMAQVASAIPTRPIGKFEVEYRGPFTTMTALRELRDGRVIVADNADKTLQLIDLTRGSAVSVGRTGAGPGEWGYPGRLHALPGDTTMMHDFTNGRWLFINPDGKPGHTKPIDDNSPLGSGNLVGADREGRMLLVYQQRTSDPRAGTSGIAHVLRYDRRSGRVDSLGTLAQPKGERSASTMLSGGLMKTVTNLPLASQDVAAITPDGRVAIVRAEPYRVEFIGLDGKRTTGPAATPSNVRINDAEKEAFTRSQIRPGAIMVRGPAMAPPPASSSASTSAQKAGQVSSAEIKAMMNPDMVWPAIKPPFLVGAAHVDPAGRVWVLRTREWNDSIPTFDVFDASGRVVERVALPKRTRLVGFGDGVAYLARTDDDDLIWLQRIRR